MIPLTHQGKKNWPGGQWDQGPGLVLHFQEEVYQLTQVPRMIPFTHQAQKIDQVDSENKNKDMG